MRKDYIMERILDEFVDVNYNDLTQLEKNIFRIVEGMIVRDNTGTIKRTKAE